MAAAAATTVNDIPYLVPQSIFIKALFVRTDILAANGINDTPKTIEELVEVSKKITNPAKNQYAFAWRGKSFEIKFADLFALPYVEDFKNAKYIYSEDELLSRSSKKGWRPILLYSKRASRKTASTGALTNRLMLLSRELLPS